MNPSIKKGKYLRKEIFAISLPRSKRLYNGIIICNTVVSLLFYYFPTLTQRNTLFFFLSLLSILPHYKVFWDSLLSH